MFTEGDIVRVEGGPGLWRVKEVGKVFLTLCADDYEWIEIRVMPSEVIEVLSP